MGFSTVQRVSDVLRQAFVKNTGSASGCVSGIGSNRAYSATFVRKPEGLDIVLWL